MVVYNRLFRSVVFILVELCFNVFILNFIIRILSCFILFYSNYIIRLVVFGGRESRVPSSFYIA